METTMAILIGLGILALVVIAFFAMFRAKGKFKIKTKLGEASAEGENLPPPGAVAAGVKIKDAEAGQNLRAHSTGAGGVDLEKVKAKGGIEATHTPGGLAPKTVAPDSAAESGATAISHAHAEHDIIAAKVVHIHQAAPAGYSPLHQLPPAPPAFTGREEDLAALEKQLAVGTGAAISGKPHAGLQGMGGVGKTALAIVLAHQVKDRYPDAQLYFNLRGADPQHRAPVTPAEAMQNVIHCFHPEARLPEALDALAPVYRSVLAEAGRVLLFLDNAADREQVRPLAPPSNCLLLVTSRQKIHLPGLTMRDLDCLPPGESRALLLKLAPRLDGQAEAAAALCGHLPLALEVFAKVVEENNLTPVPELIERLRQRQEKLTAVDAAFQVSFELLVEPLRRCWTLLGVFPAGFDLDATAAVWDDGTVAAVSDRRQGTAVPNRRSADDPQPAAVRDRRYSEARDAMQALVNASLVEKNETNDRFRLHDLVRQFCEAKLALLPAEADAARLRHARHYRDVGDQADALYMEGGEDMLRGLQLFDRERVNIEAAFEWLQTRRDNESASLLISLVDAVAYTGQELRFHPRQGIRWLEGQLQAARIAKDRQSEYNALGNLGYAYATLGEPRKAIEFYEQHRAIAGEIGDRRGEGQDLGNLGIAYKNLGETRKAIEFYEQALVIYREIGDRRNEGADLGNLGNAYAALGETRKAIEFYEQFLAIAREIGDRRGEGNALGKLGNAYAALGETRKAIEFFEQSLAIAREMGDRRGEGNALGKLGMAYKNLGEPRKAIEFYEQHRAIAGEIGDRRGEGTALGNLGIAYAVLGETRKAIEFFEQAVVIDREIGDRRGEGTDLWNSALALHELGQKAEAIARAAAALAIFEVIEDPNAAQVRATLAEWRKAKR